MQLLLLRAEGQEDSPNLACGRAVARCGGLVLRVPDVETDSMFETYSLQRARST